MVQCSNCHSEIPPDARFCAKCGAPAYPQQPQYQQYQQPPQYGPPQYQPYPYYHKEKEAALAIILSLLIPGVGQIYCGKIIRGILILLLLPILSIGLSALMYGMVITGSSSADVFIGIPLVLIIVMVIAIIFYIWQIIDAYRLAQKYNDELRRTGRPPW